MPTLFVTGHLRNYYHNPSQFNEHYLSKFVCDERVLFTHKELGWWTGDMTKILSNDDTFVDKQRLIELGFFKTIEFIDLSDRESVVRNYKVLPVCVERPYYREPSYKMQIVHRYMALKQFLSMNSEMSDDIVILTRPDILPHNASTTDYLNKAIEQFAKTNKDILVFSQMKDHLHDGIMVGRAAQLLRLFSSDVYNTRTTVDTHKNLLDICSTMFDADILHLSESFYYANSPNMGQYR